jgi:ribosomal protein S18 acetylase RimI-like enzyme
MTSVGTIRPARADDLDAIVRVFLACWHGSYADLLPPDVRDLYTLDTASAIWAQAPLDRMVVAEVPGDSVLGVTRFGPDPDDPLLGHVFSLYVHPHAQGLGLGRRLLTTATRRLRADGFAAATLWVFADNASAREFYAGQGWAPDGGERVEPAYRLPELRLRTAIAADPAVRNEHSSRPHSQQGPV